MHTLSNKREAAYLEISLKNMYGLKALYALLNIPYLAMKVRSGGRRSLGTGEREKRYS